MKRMLFILILLCMLLCMTACSKGRLEYLTEGVTVQEIQDDFYARQEQFDYVANLLFEHHELFLEQEPGSSSGSVYRTNELEWAVIKNGNDWTIDEWKAIRAILDTKGLMCVGYAKYQYPEIYFMFYIPTNESRRYEAFILHRCVADKNYMPQCANEQTSYRMIHRNYKGIADNVSYSILHRSGWYATLTKQ